MSHMTSLNCLQTPIINDPLFMSVKWGIVLSLHQWFFLSRQHLSKYLPMLFWGSVILPVSVTVTVINNSFSLSKACSWRQRHFSTTRPFCQASEADLEKEEARLAVGWGWEVQWGVI